MKKSGIYVYDRVEKKVVRAETEDEAYKIAYKDEPEYVITCPYCNIKFGVN